jgi:hypothetical protein
MTGEKKMDVYPEVNHCFLSYASGKIDILRIRTENKVVVKKLLL